MQMGFRIPLLTRSRLIYFLRWISHCNCSVESIQILVRKTKSLWCCFHVLVPTSFCSSRYDIFRVLGIKSRRYRDDSLKKRKCKGNNLCLFMTQWTQEHPKSAGLQGFDKFTAIADNLLGRGHLHNDALALEQLLTEHSSEWKKLKINLVSTHGYMIPC